MKQRGMTTYIIRILLFLSVFHVWPSFGMAKGSVNQERIRNVSLKLTNEGLYRIDFDLVVDGSIVKKTESLVLIPGIVSGEEKVWLPSVRLHGSSRCRALKRLLPGIDKAEENSFVEKEIRRSGGEILHYSVELPYEPWMDSGDLYIREERYGCGGQKKLDVYALQKRDVIGQEREVLSPRHPVGNAEVRPRVSYVTPFSTHTSLEERGSAFLDFPQSESVILPSYRQNARELDNMLQCLDKILRDPSLEILSIAITGYASPEGSYRVNERLCHERGVALQEYLRRYSNLPANLFRVNKGGEDWLGLRRAIENSHLADRSDILSIIDSYANPDEKESQLKALGESYDLLFSGYFPALRRVDYNIAYRRRVVDNRIPENLLAPAFGQLSSFDLYQLAESYGRNSRQWKEMLELTLRLYPDDPAANINAAALLLERGDWVGARICLDKVEHLPGAWNNWGVWYLCQGDMGRATEYFTRALSVGVEEARDNLLIDRELRRFTKQE